MKANNEKSGVTMRRGRKRGGMRVAVGLLLLTFPLLVLGQTTLTKGSSETVTSERLQTRIVEVKSRVELDETSRALLLGLYQQALSHMEQASRDTQRANELSEKAQKAPEQLRILHEQGEQKKGVHSDHASPVTEEIELNRLHEHLDQESASLAAAAARLSEQEKRLLESEERPLIIRERLNVAKQEKEQLTLALDRASPSAENTEVEQARRWVDEARSVALSAELHLLQQEILTLPLLKDLQKIHLTLERANIEAIQQRVTLLQDRVIDKRRIEASAAQTATEQALREISGRDPVLDRLAAQNVELTQTLKEHVVDLREMSRQRAQIERHRKRLELILGDIRSALNTYGRTEGFGRLLLQQYEALPDIRFYVRRARARERQFAKLGVGRLDHRNEARQMEDLDSAVADLAEQITAVKTQELQQSLVVLVQARQALLGKAMEADEIYLTELNKLSASEIALLDVAKTCEEFLVENLLWLRSAKPTQWQDLRHLPAEIQTLFSPAMWSEMGRAIRHETLPSPIFWLVLLLGMLSVTKRKKVRAHIQHYADRTTNPLKDRFAFSLRALFETLAAALPWPLLMAVIGWSLRWATPTSKFSYGTGIILMDVAVNFYLLRVMSLLCIPRGVAVAHFRWPESDVRLLRVALNRLIWVFVPGVLVIRFTIQQAPAETGGTMARLSLVIIGAALAIFFFHLFRSRRAWLAQRKLDPASGFLMRVYPVWCGLLIVFPLGLSILALTGYIYSAVELSSLCRQTLGLISVLIVLHQLIMRSLRIVRRRLAYAAAIKRREAAIEARKKEGRATEVGDDSLVIEEPEVDLEALSDDTRELVRMVVIAVGLLGIYLIWDELLPALRIFDGITLYNMSLGSIGLALLALMFTRVLARRLPAVLEIILLRFADLPAGSRYAATTLTTYVIVLAGAFFALNTIGLRWAQFQWLIAALGVGIGFGLQEVVANFISGLIILFERPIRVGDVVTVGETDGVVTRIRIRATTIRNWDRKELLVPNKEFITGRLLNWTLTDQVTRLLLEVGVAYGSDTDKALALLREAALEHEHVLDDPAPMASFEGFGDSVLTLRLRAYLGTIDKRIPTLTDLHKTIDRKFKEAGIVIAFPQRDVHLDLNEPLRFSAGPQDEDDGVSRTKDAGV